MKTNKKTIFITISRGSLIRNFVNTGVVSRLLDFGVRVIVITPYDKNIFPEQFEFTPLHTSRTKINRFLEEIRKAVIFNKTVNIRYLYRFSGKRPNRLLYPIRLILSLIKFIPFRKETVRFFDSAINPQNEHDYLFEKYKPDLVFNTMADGDNGIVKSAKRYGVTVIDMPKSWDNVSKKLFRVKADYVFAWGSFMKEQLIKYQGYRANQVFITGVPQFDFYTQKDFLLSREKFCEQHGLDPKKKIIFYSSTGGECCDEALYVDLLSHWIQSGKLEAQVFIRPHLGYTGDASRFNQFKGSQHPNVFVDDTDKQNHTFKDHWDVSMDHVKNLYNSLYHADVNINIASTITLDSTACGTEVVNINFDIPNSISGAIDPHTSPRRLYVSDYIHEATQTKATWLVKSAEEFLKALQKILRGEKKNHQELIEKFIYKNDGRSSDRIVSSLIEIM